MMNWMISFKDDMTANLMDFAITKLSTQNTDN